jgi:hypothetical protein
VSDIDLVVDTIFCVEILLTFFIGRHVRGKLVTRLDGIASDYLQSGQVRGGGRSRCRRRGGRRRRDGEGGR